MARTQPTWTDSYAEVNGVRLFCRSAGQGVPVVALHGGPGLGHEGFHPHLDTLATQCRVICYDQRSAGLSSGHLEPEHLTLDMHVADLEALRAFHGLEQMVLLGHSWGGLLALHYALRHPEHVKALLLCAPAPYNAHWLQQFRDSIQRNQTESDRAELARIEAMPGFAANDPPLVERWFRVLFHAYFHNPELAESLAMHMTEETVEKLDVTGTHFHPMDGCDLTDALSNIQCPTFITGGRYDMLPVEALEAMAQRMPAARLEIFQQSGHYPFVEENAAWSAAQLTFLASLPD